MALFDVIWRGHVYVITDLEKVRKQPSNNHAARLHVRTDQGWQRNDLPQVSP